VSSFSAANAPWPRTAHGWRPITSVGLLRRGTMPWSATRGCRPGSATALYARCSSGRRHRAPALRSSPACRSPRRSKSTRSATTQCSTTPTMTSAPAKRPSCSWGACRNTFGWMWRCATPRISRRPCTMHGRSSATRPHTRRWPHLPHVGHGCLRAPTPTSTAGAGRDTGRHSRRVCPGTGHHATLVPAFIPGRVAGAPPQGPLLQL
jgi:hypothetical protein